MTRKPSHEPKAKVNTGIESEIETHCFNSAAGEIAVFKRRSTTFHQGTDLSKHSFSVKDKVEITYGITSLKQLNKILKSGEGADDWDTRAIPLNTFSQYRNRKGQGIIFGMKSDTLSRLAKGGFGAFEWGKSALSNEDTWKMAEAGTLKEEDFVFFAPASNAFLSLSGEPVALALHFDYMSARTDNEQYDLDKLLEHLKKRNDIVFDPPEQPIQRIPSYNATEDRSETLNFAWTPSDEDYKKVWAAAFKAIRKNQSLPSPLDMIHAVVQSDMLEMADFLREPQNTYSP